jgi:hypothetical protein
MTAKNEAENESPQQVGSEAKEGAPAENTRQVPSEPKPENLPSGGNHGLDPVLHGTNGPDGPAGI